MGNSMESYRAAIGLFYLKKRNLYRPTDFRADTYQDTCICNINIRSVRNKLDFLRHFADEFDILAITESHLDANVRDEDLEIDVFGKSFLRKDRNNSGGGLLI